MIESTELRCYNWVMYKDKQYQLYGISKAYPFLDTIEFGVGVIQFKDLQPIPLKKEILEKLGFEYWTQDELCTDPNDAYWSKGIFSISNNSGVVHDIGSKKVRVKYLHQLQNVFYYLTGEELNYQP